MKRIHYLILALVLAFTTCLPASAKETNEETPIGDNGAYYKMDELHDSPDIVADSAIIMDANTGAILYAYEARTKRYPASITKVMTTLLAIENSDMDDIVTFSDSAVNGIEPGSSSAGINVGAKLTMEDTLYALMLVSANEAGAAIAEHVSGSNEEFANLMTERAREIGCTNTNFKNPHGLPDEEHYTTARDMALIMKQALQYKEFRKIAGTLSYTLKKSDTLPQDIPLYNHAKIMHKESEYYYKPVKGAKTGFTQAALNTLVTYAKKDGVELICVILKDYGADNSYHDTKHLYQWAFDSVKNIKPLDSEDFNLEETISKGTAENSDLAEKVKFLDCKVNKKYKILVPSDFDKSTVTTSFREDTDEAAGRLGYIDIYSGDTVIGSAPVTYDPASATAENVEEGKEIDDGLETAPVDQDKLTPSKVLMFIAKLLLCIVLIWIIMIFIRRRIVRRKRRQEIAKRHRKPNPSGNGNSGQTQRRRRSGQNDKKRPKS